MTDSELAPTVRSAAMDAALAGRDLVRGAGPWSIGWMLIPFLVGGVEAERSVSLGLLLGAAFIVGPLAILLHGGPSLIDRRAGRAAVTRPRLWLLVGVAGVLLLLGLAGLGDARAAVALALASGVAIADASPAARTADRPFIAILSRAVVVGLTAAAGLLLGGRTVGQVDWAVVAAVAGWTAGSMAIRVLASGVDDAAAAAGVGDGDTPTPAPPAPPSGLPARLLTWISAAGYALAVVLALTLGATGILAALGIASYLLLPAIVRSAPNEDAAAVRRAARRAWAERPALDILVGSWLGLLLLVHWGVLRPDPWTAAVVGVTALTGYVLGNVVVGRLATRRHRVRQRTTAFAAADRGDDRSLAIVVPCLDAASRLPGTLAALRAQTYPDTTVVVVDAGSVDGSADEAAAWLGDEAVVIAEPSPAGWSPLDWARDTGVRATESDLVLFVDADTVLAPIAARVLVEQLEAGRLDAVSGRPRSVLPTVAAQVGRPGFSLAWFGLRPGWLPALTRGRPASLAVADASFLLVRRDAYAASGGLAAVPRGSLPGVGLARTMARRGYRLGAIHAATLAARPSLDDVPASIHAWRRRTMPAAGWSLAGAIALILLEIGALLAPLLLPPLALVNDSPPAIVLMSALPLVVLIAARVVLAASEREPLVSIVWHPVTVAIALVGQAAAIGDDVRNLSGTRASRGETRLAEADAA